MAGFKSFEDMEKSFNGDHKQLALALYSDWLKSNYVVITAKWAINHYGIVDTDGIFNTLEDAVRGRIK